MNLFLFNLICAFFEHTQIFFIAGAATDTRLKTNIRRFPYIFPIILLNTMTECIWGGNALYHGISHIYFILTILIVFKQNFAHTILLYMYEEFIILLIQDFIMLLMGLSPTVLNSQSAAIIGNSLTLFACILIYKFLPLYRLYDFVLKNWIIKMMLIDVFLVEFFMNLYSKISAQDYIINFIIAFVLISLLFFSNYFIVIGERKLENQQKELEAFRTYNPIVDDLIDYVRERQHDFDNRIQAINAMTITNNDYESLCAAIRKYTGYLVKDHAALNLLKLNLRTLAGFLFSKMQQAAVYDKHLEFKVKSYSLQSIMPEYDLIEAVGILIDNAVEAVEEHDIIYITISSRDNRFFFQIKNRGPRLNTTLRSEFFRKGYSTKNSSGASRGLGLPKLKKLVDRYNGEIAMYNDINEEDTYIIFEITV